ncbi:tubulin-tyrosine ligase [Atractiella rhizophila]|nr:tubulin-tyrosine ligase [Atractiella rhizophila]
MATKTYRLDFPESYSSTRTSLEKAFKSLLPTWTHDTSSAPPAGEGNATIQFSDYDLLDFTSPSTQLFSSYPIRKSLIRKHYLALTIQQHLSKHLDCPLRKEGVPKSFVLELSFADELEEAWIEELFDLGVALDAADGGRWWILKPSMTDRGEGIRLFNSRDMLRQILEDLENEDGDVDEQQDDEGRGMSLSQLRHFVIQEYLPPLLLSPPSTLTTAIPIPNAHKFHLRVYVLAVGALKVYYHSPSVLALFSSLPYSAPSSSALESGDLDLRAHLTNTCLQRKSADEPAEADKLVFTLDELVGCEFPVDVDSTEEGQGDGADADSTRKVGTRELTKEDVKEIKEKIGGVINETFNAALAQPIHFQVRPDAFEIFGLDFLLTASTCSPQLLEMNACPDFAQTGSRLGGLIDGLLEDALKVAVLPFFGEKGEGAQGSETGWKTCLETEVSKGW